MSVLSVATATVCLALATTATALSWAAVRLARPHHTNQMKES